MNDDTGHFVTACNRSGLVIWTRWVGEESAMGACIKARQEIESTSMDWWTIFAGDPARPAHVITTKKG